MSYTEIINFQETCNYWYCQLFFNTYLFNNINGENKKLNIGEGFSGSGIVSRLFKNNSENLYVNDIAGYSYTLNNCYL